MSENLSEKHLEILVVGSGISQEVIEARGYRTVTHFDELRKVGFSRSQQITPGLLIPLSCTDGTNGICVYRPDNPRLNKKGDKVIKYEYPKGARMQLDTHPFCQPRLADPTSPLWITEGTKKLDSMVSRGLVAIALQGVWNWRGKNDVDGLTVLPDWEYVALNDRTVNVVFDSDVMTKPEVRKCLKRFTTWLQMKKAVVNVVYLPSLGDGKTGVDDFFVAGHSVEDLEALVEAPQPIPKAALPVVELLEESPRHIRRPLTLVNGVAYAAVWPWMRVTVSETVNENGEVVKHNPPKTVTDRCLVVVRGDGARFCNDALSGMPSFADLGVNVGLPEIPPEKNLWSTVGVKRYLGGYRADPADVFKRTTDVVDRFMSFDYSLSDQRTMSELVALYAISTFFTPALQVIGYIWSSGGFGSGKSKLLVTISEVAYLGMFILAGSTYATLRDLADYGATLAFDDAENVMDVNWMDADKRTLLLAGNRRGATIAVKEQVDGGKKWRTRYIDAFCPRLFSAIHLPDSVLASRSIIVPLLQTLDRGKANADPLDYSLWPHDRQTLIDDLWALALGHLPELPGVDLEVARKASLAGRALEPWRAILAVALWLDEDLFDRMDALSVAYQSEKRDLETTDLSALCAEAMMELAEERPSSWVEGKLKFSASELAGVITRLAKAMEGHSGDEPYATPQKVGVTLTKMRIAKEREDNPGRARYRLVEQDMLKRIAVTYGLTCPACPDMSTCPESEPGHVDNLGHVGHVEEGVDDIQEQHFEEKQQGDEALPDFPCCYGHTQYWRRADGSAVCDICHPQPKRFEAAGNEAIPY